MKRCVGCAEIKEPTAYSPGKSRCKACCAASTRAWRARNVDRVRAENRERVAAARRDPVKGGRIRENARKSWPRRTKPQQVAYRKALKESNFFRWKALRSYVWLTAVEMRQLWQAQAGRCALTGRPLDSTAELDHRVPRSRGGQDSYENSQWLCFDANRAKHRLLDEEFIQLCREVIAHADATADCRFEGRAA